MYPSDPETIWLVKMIATINNPKIFGGLGPTSNNGRCTHVVG